MNTRKLRRACEARLTGLQVPVPFDVAELCARLAHRRGRPIHLQPFAMPADCPCGVWIATATCDVIFYEERTSLLHQEHIILHEVGHLFCDHQTATGAIHVDTARLLLPTLDPELVRRVLNRSQYTKAEEREAEGIASVILERARRWHPVSEWSAPSDRTGIRDRVGGALESPSDRRRS